MHECSQSGSRSAPLHLACFGGSALYTYKYIDSVSAYLLTVQGLRILHDFIQNAQYYLRRHLTLQLCAFQLQIGVELQNRQANSQASDKWPAISETAK